MASQQQPGGVAPQGGPHQPAGLQQPQQQLSQQQDFDPVHRFKMLIPQLKESLQVSPLFECKHVANVSSVKLKVT